MDKQLTAEAKREIGKIYYFNSKEDAEKREEGIRLIIEASNEGDPEAHFLVGALVLGGSLKVKAESSEEHALSLLMSSANNGYNQAQDLLNRYCRTRYSKNADASFNENYKGPLKDFSGKKIRIKRRGALTPVDAVLEYKNGENILTLSVDLCVVNNDELKDPDAFLKTVIDGVMAWQGEYRVFGGQKLTVKLDVTVNTKVFDCVYVVAMTKDHNDMIQRVSNIIGTSSSKAQVNDLVRKKRSFAIIGKKWSSTSRKFIYIESSDDSFDDSEEIFNSVKHEFGHALGLGDLYQSEFDEYAGVEKGTYSELDSYYVSDNIYNLVMCNGSGPVSNNDIEMVVLAFSKNRFQLYQTKNGKGKISSALGKGN